MQAAEEAGLYDEEVFDYNEDNYRVRGFFDRLFSGSLASYYVGIWPEDISALYSLEDLRMREETSLRLVRKAILKASQTDRMVIVGRGGQCLLKDQPSALHVRIVAPVDERIQRLKEPLQTKNPSTQSETQARDLIQERNSASADYIKRFYQADWDDPLLYHLILNTGRLSLPQCIEIITHMVQHPEKLAEAPWKAGEQR